MRTWPLSFTVNDSTLICPLLINSVACNRIRIPLAQTFIASVQNAIKLFFEIYTYISEKLSLLFSSFKLLSYPKYCNARAGHVSVILLVFRLSKDRLQAFLVAEVAVFLQ